MNNHSGFGNILARTFGHVAIKQTVRPLWTGKIRGCGLMLAALVGLLALPTADAQSVSNDQAAPNPVVAGWHHVTVGVADLDHALYQWIDLMGFEVRTRQEGPDGGLAGLWGLEPEDIERQAMVGVPGAVGGFVHLVQFHDPAPPVREGAERYDMLPKNLDIYANDLASQVPALRAGGQRFLTDTYSDVETPGGGRLNEIHMFGHDHTNVVFVGNQSKKHYTDKGFAGVTQLITIVPNADRERDFYQQVLGHEEVSKNEFKGPAIEKMVGLPPGTALDVRIYSDHESEFGLMEIVDYIGAEGTDRYALAKPKALGTLHTNYIVEDLEPLRQRLAAFGTEFAEHAAVDTMFGSGPALSFETPAGLRILAHQR